MNTFNQIAKISASAAMIIGLVVPSASYAQSHENNPRQQRVFTQQERQEWIKKTLDREAAQLEIKASQEGAWEVYSNAATEIAIGYTERKPMVVEIDAATAVRQHAEQAAKFAQNLTNLADATEKLQAILDENQRKVLNRLIRLHTQLGHRHKEMVAHHDLQDATSAQKNSDASKRAEQPIKGKH